jgi:hypothetical protein
MHTLIELLEQRIRKRFPNAKTALDRPRNPAASWWLDIGVDGHAVTVEWRPLAGFGVSARQETVYGEGSEEAYESDDSAFARIEQLILTRGSTAPRLSEIGSDQ